MACVDLHGLVARITESASFRRRLRSAATGRLRWRPSVAERNGRLPRPLAPLHSRLQNVKERARERLTRCTLPRFAGNARTNIHFVSVAARCLSRTKGGDHGWHGSHGLQEDAESPTFIGRGALGSHLNIPLFLSLKCRMFRCDPNAPVGGHKLGISVRGLSRAEWK
jgi:hypothetical protein